MKKTIGYTIVSGLMIASLIVSCGEESQQHAKDAKTNIKEAVNASNKEVKEKTTAEWKNFKQDADSSIAVMEKRVQVLRVKAAKANAKDRERLNNDLNNAEMKLKKEKNILNQKYSEFESELKTFGDSLSIKNKVFQAEFKNDIKKLDTALNDLF
ncbi:uncharacterized protein YicC (UPF0701 family) [Pedobacter sp. CG_S7]|uniref:hypothetical protein n=1 Tax=Pedobacter sp. CG_S7 TaxID=3143930 RepID=UPI003392969E